MKWTRKARKAIKKLLGQDAAPMTALAKRCLANEAKRDLDRFTRTVATKKRNRELEKTETW